MKVMGLLLLLMTLLSGTLLAGKKSPERRIESIMDPAITSVAFYNPFPKSQTPSWIFRAILKEPSSSGAIMYIERVNFAEPDVVEWQNSFSIVSIEALGIKVRQEVPTDVICCSLDYLRWNEPNFEFGLKLSGNDFACTVAPEQFAKPICVKKFSIK